MIVLIFSFTVLATHKFLSRIFQYIIIFSKSHLMKNLSLCLTRRAFSAYLKHSSCISKKLILSTEFKQTESPSTGLQRHSFMGKISWKTILMWLKRSHRFWWPGHNMKFLMLRFKKCHNVPYFYKKFKVQGEKHGALYDASNHDF